MLSAHPNRVGLLGMLESLMHLSNQNLQQAGQVIRTGVKGKLSIRLAFKPASLQPAVAGFAEEGLLDQDILDPSQLMHSSGTGQVINIAGEVLAVSAVSSPGGAKPSTLNPKPYTNMVRSSLNPKP